MSLIVWQGTTVGSAKSGQLLTMECATELDAARHTENAARVEGLERAIDARLGQANSTHEHAAVFAEEPT